MGQLGIQDLTNQNVENWLDGVIEDWIAQGESILIKRHTLRYMLLAKKVKRMGLNFYEPR